MNYLAHAYLSFDDAALLAGNMFSDFVKGKAQYDFPPSVYKGIRLHRHIDAFTDAHSVTAELKKIFQPQYRLYSGAFTDIVYDHFLARDAARFQPYGGLLSFTQHSYEQLESFSDLFPPRFAGMFPYMKSQNWLYHYASPQGIQKSFNGLVRRAKYLSESDIAYGLFLLHYDTLEQGYLQFFPALHACAKEVLKEI